MLLNADGKKMSSGQFLIIANRSQIRNTILSPFLKKSIDHVASNILLQKIYVGQNLPKPNQGLSFNNPYKYPVVLSEAKKLLNIIYF